MSRRQRQKSPPVDPAIAHTASDPRGGGWVGRGTFEGFVLLGKHDGASIKPPVPSKSWQQLLEDVKTHHANLLKGEVK